MSDYELVSRPKETPPPAVGGYELVSRPKPAPAAPQPAPAAQPMQGVTVQGQKPAPPFGTRLSNNYNADVNSAVGNMREGAAAVMQPGNGLGGRAMGAGQAILGALGYVSSPVDALLNTTVGDPAANAVGAMGAPQWAQDTARTTASGVAGMGVGAAGALAREIPGMARAAMPMINRGATAVGGVLRGGVDAVEDVAGSIAQGARNRVAQRAADAPPTREELGKMTQAAYSEAKKIGVKVQPEQVNSLLGTVDEEGNAVSGGIDDVLRAAEVKVGTVPPDPKTYKETLDLAKRLEAYRGHELTLPNLMQMQKEANSAVRRAMLANEGKADEDVRAATMLSQRIRQFVQEIKPENEAAIDAWTRGKELARRQAKYDQIENIVDVAKGINKPEYIQQQFQSLRKDQFEFGQFSPAEQKLIEEIAAEDGMGLQLLKTVPIVGKTAAKALDIAARVRNARQAKAEELMGMIAKGEEAQKAAAAAKAQEPSAFDTINSMLRPQPENSANRRFSGPGAPTTRP